MMSVLHNAIYIQRLSERDKLEQLAEKFFQGGEDWMLSKRGREQ